jgi:hypothetical protein
MLREGKYRRLPFLDNFRLQQHRPRGILRVFAKRQAIKTFPEGIRLCKSVVESMREQRNVVMEQHWTCA